MYDMYDVIIIGGGPAGATAAVYTARSRLNTLVLDKAPNTGALALTHKIANYPGIAEALSGKELLDRIRDQAAGFGAKFKQTTITAVDLDGPTKYVFTAEGIYEAKAVIIATGSKGRNRMLPGEEKLLGRGVSTCATCDGAFFEGKEIAVVGDSEEALDEVMALDKLAAKVHFIIPRGELQGVEALPELSRTQYYFKARPQEVAGEERVEGLRVKMASGAEQTLPVEGVFVFLSGSKPGTDFLEGQVPLDESGYMILDEYMQSPVPGVFGAGEVRRSPVKQAIVAAADGAIAAMAADKFIHRREQVIPQYK
ncbi:FAD-dependent oxidoreductase [Paenibacillus doosanensis]|uniref:Thioredoxin reductase n=1 Tax=Paenibacillus konkukensis TaxID=2020716 RepID=A0ABY4RMY1_9BACL|nr:MULTISPECIES: FAD-dependent oxidoreductase [Paenibacillus]MCS7463952.1 FAD-dependent oxidoreductase [Paenibacillus doosanensis]UQZ83832.1 Thioredoxin reductase [Paenibacillus konkukensis]